MLLPVLDQALFSLANLIVLLVAARSLTPRGYGLFALWYAGLVLGIMLHRALVIEPYLVFSRQALFSARHRYIRELNSAHRFASLSALVILLLLTAWPSLKGPANLHLRSLLSVAATGPLVMFAALTRRQFYATGQFWNSVATSLAYLASIGVTFWLLPFAGSPSPGSVFIRIGCACGVATAVGGHLGRPRDESKPNGKSKMTFFRRLVDRHWQYGKWAVAESGAAWLLANAIFYAVGLTVGASATGDLRALYNVIQPIQQAMIAVAVALIPTFSSRVRTGELTFRVDVGPWMFGFGIAALTYVALTTLFGSIALDVLYGGRFTSRASMLPLLALVAVPGGMAAVVSAALRGQASPNRVFVASGIAAIIALSGTVLGAKYYGMTGAIVAEIVAYGAQLSVLLILWSEPQRVRKVLQQAASRLR